MLRKFAINWVLHPWKFLSVMGGVALLACVPILFPFAEGDTQQTIRDICGWLIMLCMVLSVTQVVVSTVLFFLRLKNLRAIWQLMFFFIVCWVVWQLFISLAIEADTPSPYPEEEQQLQQLADTIHETKERLKGPSALSTYLAPLQLKATATTLHPAANLLKLEKDYPEIFEQYLNTAPKWAYAAHDDTFYSKPGHAVMIAETDEGLIGAVHVAFRSVSAGETMPDGYVVKAPGNAISAPEENETDEIPDFALDLGGKRYLLLAWRGSNAKATAYNAINAAIAEIDQQLAPLAATPTPDTIEKLIQGEYCIKDGKTELLMNEPASQFGIYQAEIYANPGRKGTLILVIRERDTNKTLLLYSHAAQYSADPTEVFRHDVPLALHDMEGRRRLGSHAEVFDKNAPFFTIKLGESHRYFTITAEVHFSPAGSPGDKTELLLKRHYNVQAFETEEDTPQLPTK